MRNFLRKIAVKLLATLLVSVLTLAFFATVNIALGQDTNGMPPAPEAEITDTGTADTTPPPSIPPSASQRVDLQTEGLTGFQRSERLTAGLKFLVRGKEALSWVMGIQDGGFDNPALSATYGTVLTIVNSLFILGLLGIAVMWMFSLIIPRHQLKKVILVYAFAVVFVNFALPANRLLIDGANLLQKTLLTRNGNPIGIVDVVNTPAYQDAVGYENQAGKINNLETRDIKVSLMNNGGGSDDLRIGALNPTGSSIVGEILSAGGSIQGTILPSSQDLNLKSAPFIARLESQKEFNPNAEQEIFSFVLLLLTGAAYLAMALIFLFRLVILWGLLILSPVLLLLAVFETTRGYFYNWLSLYGRWLVMGPLIALGLSAMVNIWQTVGLPLQSQATNETFTALSNIRFFLPGSVAANTLSTTSEMMQYLLFLIMLTLPLFFGFALTRQKLWSHVSVSSLPVPGGRVKSDGPGPTSSPETKPTPESPERGVIAGIKDFVSEKMGKVTRTALPSQTSTRENPPPGLLGASSFLPEQLTLTGIPDMLGLLGANTESRHSHDRVVDKLASPERIADPGEQKNVLAVRQEIETRAERGEPEAVILKSEIETRAQAPLASIAPPPTPETTTAEPSSAMATEPLKTVDDDIIKPKS